MASRSRASLCAIAVLLCTVAAQAEPSAAQKEAARTLMAEARERRDKQDLKGALSRFQAADAIMNVPTTGFEVAKTQAELGLWVEALTTVRRILTTPAKPDDPEPFRVARSKAADLGDSLRTRVSSLHLVVTGLPAGVKAAIFVDHAPVASDATNTAFPVNPGHHRVVAKASGQEITGEVDAVEHETAEVELQFANDGSAPRSSTDRPASGAHASGLNPLFYAGGATAIAGIALGSVTGLLALSKKHAAEAQCVNGACPPSSWDNLDSAHSLSTVSTVGFIVGAVGIAVATGSFFIGDSPPASQSGSIALAPSVGASGGTLTFHGRF